ncbi:MAG: helix-turn-helix transcriptional regulator [Sphingobacteriaceae bacterium]|nr:helix-turn-helix transcriptional regulator [Sphingobacteriaceae bacterium]
MTGNSFTLQEIVEIQMTVSTDTLKKEHTDLINSIAAVSKHLPAVVIIHDLRDWSVVWMSERGLQQLGVTLEEITKITSDDYYARHFNQEDAKDYVPKIMELLQTNNDDNICTYFQQVRFKNNPDWQWHMSGTKILAKNEDAKPLLTITIALPIDAMHHMSAKASRLLDEKNFLVKHYKDYAKLGKRESDVLKLLVLGKNSTQIGEELFISATTVDTHRRNIKRKLKVGSLYELLKYAHAFDLIP